MSDTDDQSRTRNIHERSQGGADSPTRETLALEKIADAIGEWTKELRSVRDALNRLANRVGRSDE